MKSQASRDGSPAFSRPAERKTIRSSLPFALAQQILGKPGAVRRIYVSAVTKPEDAFARRDPKSLSPEMYDRWYCSPYAQSIAFQLQEAIPHSHAEQIRQVAQNEGTVLSRIQGLMLLITLAALLASALAVSASMATAVFERRSEVGLMKALGAGNLAVAVLFFAEAALLALIAGAHWLRRRRAAGPPDRPIHLRLADHDPASALARHSDHCRDRDLWRQRRRHPARGKV